jgi:2-keto-3-deoxy-L-rhamnonate aldolase RhmA
MHYAPQGERGACPMVRAAGYTRGDWNAYASRANAETLAIPLLEDEASIADFDALAATPGLDIFFVGPTDLAISLGVPGATFDDPKMRAALEKVVAAAKKRGKYVMTTIGNRLDIEYGRDVAQRGVQLIVYGTDADLFVDAMRRLRGMKQ